MATEDEPVADPPFPWIRAAALILTVWASLTGAGLLGGALAEQTYLDKQAPTTPYTAQQIATLEEISPAAAGVARRDARLWAVSVGLGSSLARAEGTLLGSTTMSALWAVTALGWVVKRLRERRRVAAC